MLKYTATECRIDIEINIQWIGGEKLKRKWTLKELRVLHGMTQTEMALKVGIHPNTYREYEADISRVRIGTILRICEVLGIKPTEIQLFTKEG